MGRLTQAVLCTQALLTVPGPSAEQSPRSDSPVCSVTLGLTDLNALLPLRETEFFLHVTSP